MFCVVAVLPTIPAALSAEYPACDSSHWAFQLLARSISAKGEKNSLHALYKVLKMLNFNRYVFKVGTMLEFRYPP